MRKFHPILFSTPMVRAILKDRKTMTRRVIKFKGKIVGNASHNPEWRLCGGLYDMSLDEGEWGVAQDFITDNEEWSNYATYNAMPGDILWVRETAQCVGGDIEGNTDAYPDGVWIYKADGPKAHDHLQVYDHLGTGWRPSIFMPKVASRIFLEVVSIRAERLNDISEGDSVGEGVRQFKTIIGFHYGLSYSDETFRARSAKGSFSLLWESINGKNSWKANPWVWVIEFKRIEKPEDFK